MSSCNEPRVDLAPCVFCADARVAVVQLNLSNRVRVGVGLAKCAAFVECVACRARGPIKYGDGPASSRDAAAAWNAGAAASSRSGAPRKKQSMELGG